MATNVNLFNVVLRQDFVSRFPKFYKAYLSVTAVISVVTQKLYKYL